MKPLALIFLTLSLRAADIVLGVGGPTSWSDAGGGVYIGRWTVAPSGPIIADQVAHWKMNDNAANTVVLDSKGSYNGTASANTSSTFVNTGKLDRAFLKTAGDGTYVTVPSFDMGQPFSIAAWFFVPANGTLVPIISQPDGWAFYFDGFVTPSMDLYNTVEDIKVFTGEVSVNAWHHVVATGDGSGNFYVFLDGVSSALLTYGDITGTGTALRIGTDSRIPGNTASLIDDVRIYSRPLTDTEVGLLYNAGAGTEAE